MVLDKLDEVTDGLFMLGRSAVVVVGIDGGLNYVVDYSFLSSSPEALAMFAGVGAFVGGVDIAQSLVTGRSLAEFMEY